MCGKCRPLNMDKKTDNMNNSKPIRIIGAREHNLKNVTVEIPRNSLTVITGLSGSGKSSLAFDTLFAEGQRRYVESLSSYARQFIDTLEKPDFDMIDGLSPAIAIDQRSASRNPRSTVGTTTEIYDFFRLLFARCGVPHCANHPDQELISQTPQEVLDRLMADLTSRGLPQKIVIYAPLISDKKGEHRYVLTMAKKNNLRTILVDGVKMSVDEALNLEISRGQRHTIEAEILSFGVYANDRETLDVLHQAIVKAFKFGGSRLRLAFQDSDESLYYSELHTCPACGFTLPSIEPRLFSFNSPQGACPFCQGLGTKKEFSVDLILPNLHLTLGEGAVRPWSRITSHSNWYNRTLNILADNYGVSLDMPINELTDAERELLIYGDKANKFTGDEHYEGIIPNLQSRLDETDSDYLRAEIEKYMVEKTCPSCKGQRLRAEILGITINGNNIVDITSKTIRQTDEFFKAVKAYPRNEIVFSQLSREIEKRLEHLIEVGVEYLTLDRNTSTLAGGEAQRIRLATQLGSQLMGVIYVLDEPSIGLHRRDHERLLKSLYDLRDIDNTVVVVEHDELTMRSADYIIDVGPGAGEQGGEIIATGTPEEIMANTNSLTGAYLSGRTKIEIPKVRRKEAENFLTVYNASEFNLKDITVQFPLQRFVCVTGVSGSGKSTLVDDILANALSASFNHAKVVPGKHSKITGVSKINKVIAIDQTSIGRTPRSNPVTYAGIFGSIRELFAQTPEAQERGFDVGHFSFNLRGGRCEVCKGDGALKVEMNFLPDVYVTCQECKGKRYNDEILQVLYKGKTIAEVLNLTVEEAVELFSDSPLIHHKLFVLKQVGLGYIRLGQSATTLSGGEAQRIKLATELSRQSTGNTLYILDEPTTGLHFEDIRRLLAVLQALVDKGNSVIVVEHDLDVIKCADWVIDLGPEGGGGGGYLVAEGTPETVAKNPKSYTGQYLAEILANKTIVKPVDSKIASVK